MSPGPSSCPPGSRTSTLMAPTPQRATRRTSIWTSGMPSRPGKPRSHASEAPAATSAPRSMSPLIPADGSRIAKRLFRIDLEYHLRTAERQTRSPACAHGRPMEGLYTVERATGEPVRRRAMVLPTEGRNRVVIEGVDPEIDGGRFPIKRVSGEVVVVEADVFADGHDQLECRLLYRRDAEEGWQAVPLTPLGNDRWRGEFIVTEIGTYWYTIEGWISRFRTWRADLRKRVEAAQDVRVDLLIGAGLIEDVAGRAVGPEAERLRAWAHQLRQPADLSVQAAVALDDALAELVLRYPDRGLATRYERELGVVVDREKARFSTWYEVFPRSCAAEPGRHGTFRDCEAWLPYVAGMGFDVLYLPPVHPVGTAFRQGKNNTETAGPDEVGRPWAIG